MNVYHLLRINQFIKNYRLKFLGIFLLHITKQRYLALHFDPINACNLRCKMCYFSDKDYVKKLKGVYPSNEIDYLGNAFFKRAIKLQIGCGTEPTLYKDIDLIVKTASKHKVPHISLITNAHLLEKEKLEQWIISGLSEISISLHGVKKTTYETMMTKGNFDCFLNALKIITEIKKKYALLLRVNYTFNEDNFEELKSFYTVFGKYDIDILQIRPLRKMGNTEYQKFNLNNIIPIYDEVHQFLIYESRKRNVKLMAHSLNQINNRVSMNSVINKYVYCYISPSNLFNEKFIWKKDTYEKYSKRVSLKKQILYDVFSNKNKLLQYQSDKLNYEIN